MDVKIIYWISLVLLWICIAANFWCIARNRKQYKMWKNRIRDANAVIKAATDMKRSYERRIKELLTSEEK